MNQPHDPYGRPGYGAPPPHGAPPPYGYPPEEPKSQTALIIGLCAGFVVVLLITLWATGALDRMFGSGNPTASVSVNATVPAPAAKAAAPAPAPAAPAPVAAPAPAPAPVIDNNWIAGRWCEGSGATVTFDAATGQAIIADPTGGTLTYSYDLSGTRLTFQGPGGEVRASVNQNGSDNFSLSAPGQPRESYTRC